MDVQVEFRHKSYLFLPKENTNLGGYTCLVKSITIKDPNSHHINIIGNHQENETNRSVVGISIRNQTQVQQFPRGFGLKFPNLKYFEIDNSSLTMLHKEDFLDLGHLLGLWMPRNAIVALPNDLFMNVQGLRYLSFHKNKLKFIGHDILKPLKNLERANFLENTTIDIAYNGGAEELAILNREIAMKCMAPKQMQLGLDSKQDKIYELEKRVQVLELKVNKLEAEKNMQAAKLAQITSIQSMIEVLESRLDIIDNRMDL